MKSQVSFRYSGSHNTSEIVRVLKSKLKGLKYSVSSVGCDIYKIYVASEDGEVKTFNVCRGIQCFCKYDYSRDL